MHLDFRFATITVFIIALNLLYALLQIGLLRRLKPSPRFLDFAVGAWAFSMIGLFLLQLFAPSSWESFLRRAFYLPLGVEMVWNLLFLLYVVLILILVTVFARRRRPVAPPSPDGLSRRKFIYLLSYGAVPATALGMGVHGTLTYHDLRVRRFDIPVAGLPPEFEGFTIAHVSDLHSGIFCGPSRLKIIRDAVNDLKADLVVITGDIINREMSEFPVALEAMQGMESRYGTYLCEGNHDRIPGPGLVLDACLKNNLPMLFNTGTTLTVEGHRLLLGGLPWMNSGFQKTPELVSALYPARQPGDVRILLAHHPHLFDIADSVDLVLSGHTHGGQIMLTDHIGYGPLMFKYWSGFYHRGNTTMVVSNGCGDWFPCRIGALAEIGLLRLTATKAG